MFIVGYWIYPSLSLDQTFPELNSFNWKKVFLSVVFSHWKSDEIDTHCFFLLCSLQRLGFIRASCCFDQKFSFQISLFQSSIAYARVNLSLHFSKSTCSREHSGRVWLSNLLILSYCLKSLQRSRVLDSWKYLHKLLHFFSKLYLAAQQAGSLIAVRFLIAFEMLASYIRSQNFSAFWYLGIDAWYCVSSSLPFSDHLPLVRLKSMHSFLHTVSRLYLPFISVVSFQIFYVARGLQR